MPETKCDKPFVDNAARLPEKPCPICGKPAVLSARPFCSTRCANVDLYRWLGGVYAIPAVDAAPEDADKEAGDRDAAQS